MHSSSNNQLPEANSSTMTNVLCGNSRNLCIFQRSLNANSFVIMTFVLLIISFMGYDIAATFDIVKYLWFEVYF